MVHCLLCKKKKYISLCIISCNHFRENMKIHCVFSSLTKPSNFVTRTPSSHGSVLLFIEFCPERKHAIAFSIYPATTGSSSQHHYQLQCLWSSHSSVETGMEEGFATSLPIAGTAESPIRTDPWAPDRGDRKSGGREEFVLLRILVPASYFSA